MEEKSYFFLHDPTTTLPMKNNEDLMAMHQQWSNYKSIEEEKQLQQITYSRESFSNYQQLLGMITTSLPSSLACNSPRNTTPVCFPSSLQVPSSHPPILAGVQPTKSFT